MRYYKTEYEDINRFRGEYYFLSNFYPVVIVFDGITYLSSESAYQAQKCQNVSDRQQFSKLSADESKRLGSKVHLRPDWNEVKLPLMKEIVRAKFTQHRYLAEWILGTGDKELKEGNTWRDTFWGIDLKTGEGENHLGKILMGLRKNFKENGLPDESDSPRMRFDSALHISVVFGDITQSDCMCIVNAANKSLLEANGSESMLHFAAGSELMKELKALDNCPVADVKITRGYNLKAQYIIHTVAPHYPQKDCEMLLRRAYRNTLELAKEYGITSIAFPAISTGACSYPKKEATKIAVETVYEWIYNNPDSPIKVEFTCDDNTIYNNFYENIKQIG